MRMLCMRRTIARLEAGLNGYLDQVGWINTRAHAYAMDREGREVPWLTYPAIMFLSERVRDGWRLLEFGAGSGTVWWSKRVHHVTAIEHDRGWADEVEKKCVATVRLADPSSSIAYLEHSQPRSYDIVVIDGLFRNECAFAAPDLLVGGGVIVLYDAQRPAYQPALDFLRSSGFSCLKFHGPQPVNKHPGCTAIFYKQPNVLEI